ncbi:hypothetical protein VIOR3934_04054 [Vibrio orientalis CIP 102891 = ATCC 33934]|uniref:Uncharacterized protein n=1 Tax=Vibrio orientalis CIP 102891 = ATCC 33934 TaxID=675816 RepID=F9SNL1_VIBOR|nr:hypothetical protein VIOR3934_04054 [Vibrio orientalis CIP 102891 = ATCC 33934]
MQALSSRMVKKRAHSKDLAIPSAASLALIT